MLERGLVPRNQGSWKATSTGLARESRVQGLGLGAEPAALREKEERPREWEQSQAQVSKVSRLENHLPGSKQTW